MATDVRVYWFNVRKLNKLYLCLEKLDIRIIKIIFMPKLVVYSKNKQNFCGENFRFSTLFHDEYFIIDHHNTLMEF